MKNPVYVRNVTLKLGIKGHLTGDASQIEYVNSEGDVEFASISALLSRFADKDVEVTITEKSSEDLGDKDE